MPKTVRLLTPLTIVGEKGRGPGDIVTIDDQFADNLIATNQAELAPVTNLGGVITHTVDSLTNSANPNYGAPGIIDGATYQAAAALSANDEAWVSSVDAGTLAIGRNYILQSGHDVNMPAISNANDGKSLKIMPANNDWFGLGANINLSAGDSFSSTGLMAGSNSVRFVARDATKTWLVGL